jgi:hypothetical protein
MENKMQRQYKSPEIQLVGTADAVVLGSLATGDDHNDEFAGWHSEFEADVEVTQSQAI